MTEDCILAIDAGTTGVTCLLVDHDGTVRARGSSELTQHYPQPGWVEHDADEIWQAVLTASAAALAGSPELRPVAVGIANQRETMLFWDRRTGEPLHRAIVWQCRRSAGECEELRTAGMEPEIVAKTGLKLDPYFSGTKALWLTRHDVTLPRRIADGSVCFGTIDSWLTWRLSGGRVHATDYTNASRTLAFDIDKLDWDDGLLDVFGLDRSVMPQPGPSGSVRGVTENAGGHTRWLTYRLACGRPAGSAVRPGLLRARPDQGDLRHRLLYPYVDWKRARAAQARAARHPRCDCWR